MSFKDKQFLLIYLLYFTLYWFDPSNACKMQVIMFYVQRINRIKIINRIRSWGDELNNTYCNYKL